MKSKSLYEKDLEYQLQLVRAIDSLSGERELALSLLEYGRLQVADKLSRAEKERLLHAIDSVSGEIREDHDRLESFKWIYLAKLSAEKERQAIAQAVSELCGARFPFLSDYLFVTLTEAQEKLVELRKSYPHKRGQ